MHGPSQEQFLSKLKDALLALQGLNVTAVGPFVTPKKNRMYLVGGCVLTESEIVALHDSGQFTRDGIAKLLDDLKSLQSPNS